MCASVAFFSLAVLLVRRLFLLLLFFHFFLVFFILSFLYTAPRLHLPPMFILVDVAVRVQRNVVSFTICSFAPLHAKRTMKRNPKQRPTHTRTITPNRKKLNKTMKHKKKRRKTLCDRMSWHWTRWKTCGKNTTIP